uniref:Uncharacterized protein n=1 Tax=Craspedostauros australis TaxID=1486917 RepID=A0A7R9ZS88_9STRA|mmetsp:Transcript_7892/g.21326  ORF Transcript_7892/g.21326 Transcript_7892/m.21326 type:complete len:112 (+) Transcript_7892:375-710(+)
MSVMAPKSNNDSNDSIPFHNLRTMARHSMEMDFFVDRFIRTLPYLGSYANSQTLVRARPGKFLQLCGRLNFLRYYGYGYACCGLAVLECARVGSVSNDLHEKVGLHMCSCL